MLARSEITHQPHHYQCKYLQVLAINCLNRVNHAINYFNRALIVVLTHISLVLCYLVGMWRSLHSNSTTFKLQTFLADSKMTNFFTSHRRIRISGLPAPHVYTKRPPEQVNNKCDCLIVWKNQKWY